MTAPIMTPVHAPVRSIRGIVLISARCFDVPWQTIYAADNRQRVMLARHGAVLLARWAGYSNAEIGKLHLWRGHRYSVNEAAKRARRLLAEHRDFAERFDRAARKAGLMADSAAPARRAACHVECGDPGWNVYHGDIFDIDAALAEAERERDER